MNPLVSGSVAQILAPVSKLEEDQKMWMFDRAIETITDAPAAVRTLFMEFVDQASVTCEEETDLSRWAWQRIVQRRMNPVEPHTDASCESTGQYNFIRAIAHTGLKRSMLIPKEKLEVVHVEAAMEPLTYLSARQRRILVMACTASVFANQSTNLEEAWVLRAICEGFNFPMPAVLPGHPIESGV